MANRLSLGTKNTEVYMNKFTISVLTFLFLFTTLIYGQKINVKTNPLYLVTSTPNFGVEFALSKKVSFSLSGGLNFFDLASEIQDDGSIVKSKIKHYLVMPEFKYWTCRSFERSFFGLHGIYSHFNMSNISFIKPIKDYRYQGDAFGGGLSYGYQWAMGKRWGIEASLGVGYLHLDYEKFDKEESGKFLGNFTHDYVGPTKIELSFLYFLK